MSFALADPSPTSTGAMEMFLCSLQNPLRCLIAWAEVWPQGGIKFGEEGLEWGWPDTVCCDSPTPALHHSQDQEGGRGHIPDKPFSRKGCWEGTPVLQNSPGSPGTGSSPGFLSAPERFSAAQRRGDLQQEKPFLGWDGILPKRWLKGIQDKDRRNQG